MLIKCDKYSLGVGESNLEAEGVITLTASNATIHSGFPCINFNFEIMIPKKGSKPKNLRKQTIY